MRLGGSQLSGDQSCSHNGGKGLGEGGSKDVEVSTVVLSGATAVTVCRLRPECQQLSLPRPATPRPLHLCPSLSIPQTGPAFWRQSWNSGDASRESQSHRRCPVPGEVSGRAEGPLQACPWELENSKTYTLHPGAMTSRERRQGHRGPACPSHIPTLCLAWARCWNPSEGGSVPNFVKFTISSGDKRVMSGVRKPMWRWNGDYGDAVATR